jgi:type VII secretion-associated serine protease mycosin
LTAVFDPRKLLAAGAVALVAMAPPAYARAEAGTARACSPEPGVQDVTGRPWAQERLKFRQVWSLSQGDGVVVAVVDSGVDSSHPQLAGKVVESVDVTGTGTDDCVGHGTAVAGIIAARDLTSRGVPFMGVAPGARILAVKQTDRQDGDVARLAEGIRRAADLGAQVINVSVQAYDQPDLKAAVTYAQGKDVVIVAAAGNVQQQGGPVTPSYPANYPGVIAVGSASRDGTRSEFSNGATRVSVTAPGDGITSTWVGGGYRTDLQGTSFATPYVAGVAALVRSRYPELDYWQVKRRIEITANGGGASGTGAGMVNPTQAVSAVLPDAAEPDQQATRGTGWSAVVDRRAEPDRRARAVAIGVAGGAAGVTGLVVFGALTIPRGRRRRWRPGVARFSE